MGFQALGQLQQGRAAEAAAEFNSKVAEQNANYAIYQSVEEARRIRIQDTKTIGLQRATYAANGVTQEGSPSDVIDESVHTMEMDALNIKYKGLQDAAAYRNEAILQSMRGASAQESSQLGAAGTLIGGAGKLWGTFAPTTGGGNGHIGSWG